MKKHNRKQEGITDYINDEIVLLAGLITFCGFLAYQVAVKTFSGKPKTQTGVQTEKVGHHNDSSVIPLKLNVNEKD